MGFLDIAKLNRELFNLTNTASLAFMTLKLVGKRLSKKEQISNWARRPLRKTQLHYAAMDAYLCIILYKKLIEVKLKGVQNFDD